MATHEKVVRLGKEAYVGLAWNDAWLLGTSAVMVTANDARREALCALADKL